eukprot:9428128-Pyramimonas_sp.AAC.1
MVGNAGMQKNRLQAQKCKFATETHPTYFLRPSNGRSGPGIKCPESLCMRITDLTTPGAPCYSIHGTQSANNIPNALRTGLSCSADDTAMQGQTICSWMSMLLGDSRIQSGPRVDSEVLLMISLKNLLHDSMSNWCSGNDIIMTAGRNGIIPPIHIVQLTGILPNVDQRRFNGDQTDHGLRPRVRTCLLPAFAGQPASFALMGRAIWDSTECWEHQQPAGEAPEHSDGPTALPGLAGDIAVRIA